MTMTLHTIKPAVGSSRKEKRVGRGNASGHGTYSTRGVKGQRARSGGRRGLKLLGMKRIIAQMPKSRGFLSHKPRAFAVQLSAIAAVFGANALVTSDALKEKGLAPRNAARIKIIGGGKVPALTIKGVATSSGARAAIESVGGQVEVSKASNVAKAAKV